MLKKKLLQQRQFVCAQTIQKVFRGYICRKWYRQVHEIRTVVAIKWQRLWRRYYRRVVEPRKQRERELAVVTIIQKSCRGYLSRRRTQIERADQIIEQNYQYFRAMRQKAEFPAAVMIYIHMKRWYAKLRAKRLKEMERKARMQNAKGKGKKGAPKKKPAAKPAAATAPKTAAGGKISGPGSSQNVAD